MQKKKYFYYGVIVLSLLALSIQLTMIYCTHVQNNMDYFEMINDGLLIPPFLILGALMVISIINLLAIRYKKGE